MKKALIIVVLLALVTLIAISWGLRKNDSTKTNTTTVDEPIVVLSTFTIIADMVSEVGGDKVKSVSLTKPGAEIHGYEPTPSDLVRASEADVIFENGMNLELWTEKLKANIPDVPVVSVSKGVGVINISEDAYAGKPNPHAWMSPKQGLVYVEHIRRALTKLLPEDAAYFAARADAYAAQISAIGERLNIAMATLPENNRVLVTCEGAFSYLANDYNLEEVYLWPINAESQGTPKQVTKVIKIVNERKIPAVFCESTVAPRLQTEVANATNARLGGVLYVDSLSEADGPAPTYLALLEHTATTIISGLTESENQ